MARKKNNIELQEFFTSLFNKVSGKFAIDEIILFGSYAKGTARADSDIDVAIISPDLNSTSIYCNTRTIKDKVKLYDPDLQLFSFSPALYYQEEFVDPGFVQEIKRTGRSIYTKEKGLDFSAISKR